jgi:transcriptional regulator with PAS, ATPase and Fis domain
MLPASYHSHPYSTHRTNTPIFLTARERTVVESMAAPPDCAIIVTDELGNIKDCNAEAQSVFHCLPSYTQDKKLDEIVKIAPRNHARYSPTLWELAHTTQRRPIAFPELEVAFPCEGKHLMDICSVWLHEAREGHSRVAFIFSTPTIQLLKSPAGNRIESDEVQTDIEEGIIVLQKHSMIETSHTLDAMLGYKTGELIGRDISSLLSDADVTTLTYAAKTHNTQMFQGLAVRRNGFLESVRFRCFPLVNVRPDVVVVRLYGRLP